MLRIACHALRPQIMQQRAHTCANVLRVCALVGLTSTDATCNCPQLQTANMWFVVVLRCNTALQVIGYAPSCNTTVFNRHKHRNSGVGIITLPTPGAWVHRKLQHLLVHTQDVLWRA